MDLLYCRSIPVTETTSLQSITAHRIVVDIVSEVCVSFYTEYKKCLVLSCVEVKAREKIEELYYPKSLKNELLALVHNVSVTLMIWEGQLNFVTEIPRRLMCDRNYLNYGGCTVWRGGYLDEYETAKEILRKRMLPPQQLYELACAWSVVDMISSLKDEVDHTRYLNFNCGDLKNKLRRQEGLQMIEDYLEEFEDDYVADEDSDARMYVSEEIIAKQLLRCYWSCVLTNDMESLSAIPAKHKALMPRCPLYADYRISVDYDERYKCKNIKLELRGGGALVNLGDELEY